jgi:hypothetical protein
MALSKRGDCHYGSTSDDTRAFLADYSADGYPAQHFAECRCGCGGKQFRLALDETQGAAVRTCNACESAQPIADSAEYLEEASLEECACPCGAEAFELTIGVSLYADSRDVRWLFVGARCSRCGLIGCYGDWKNEYLGYEELLAHV